MPVRPIPLAQPGLLPRQTRLPTPTIRHEPWLEDSIPTRELLQSCPPHYLVHGSSTRADLRLVKVQNTVWVIKDFSACAEWFRLTLGSWLIARELAALRKLKGLDGVPESAVRVDRFAFAYKYAEGVPLNAMLTEHLSSEFFNRLETLTEAMHRCGIVHLNLREGSNILVTSEQRPVLLDFQAHLRLPRGLGGLLRLLARVDFNAIHLLWNRHMEAVLSAESKPVRRIRT